MTSAQAKAKRLTTWQKIFRASFSLVVFLGIIAGIFILLHVTGVLQKFDEPQDVKEFILQGGVWSYFLFVLIQFLQVTILPLPAWVTTMAGALIFGPWVTYFLSLFAVMLGSIFAFWLGKKFGRKVVVWVVGKEDADKWDKRLFKGKYLFFLMLLFPGFPDDLLCLLVGATPMTYRFFIAANAIARPIVFLPMVFLGSGDIIPYTGWGIAVWIILVLFFAVSFYLSIRYQAEIEAWLNHLATRMKRWFTKVKK